MRKTVIILTCCTAILLAGYAGYRGYKVWKQNHMLALAHGFLAKSDARNAVLSLQQVLRTNPRNVEATRLMAQLAEASRSPNALLLRSRVVELNPHSLDDRLALAQTALVFRDIPAATNALEGIDATARNSAAYHNVAGAVAVAISQRQDAEAHFTEAARLEPTNPVPRLNLAILRLHSTNTLDMAEARIALQRIIQDPTAGKLHPQSLRELIADAVRNKQNDDALNLCQQLVQDTNSTFNDRLLRVAIFQQAKSADFKPALATLKQEAATNSAKIYELTQWQMANTSSREALAWLNSLPVDMKTNQPVPMLAAECRSTMQDWTGLQQSLTNQNWAELEFVRHAYMMRGLRGQNLDAAAKGEWEQAFKEADGRKERLKMLFQLAGQWRWQSEAEEVLWATVNEFPDDKQALQTLSRVLFVNGRTRPLMTLFSQELRRSPSDLDIKNNLALTAMLLDARELAPFDMAREVYEKAPTNASYVSTYAFALHLQKKDADALKLMQKLTPKDLEVPSISGYYGVILKANGNTTRARSYLEWSSRAQVLPEERKLFDQAKVGT